MSKKKLITIVIVMFALMMLNHFNMDFLIFKNIYLIYDFIVSTIFPIILGGIISYILYVYFSTKNLEKHIIRYINDKLKKNSILKYNYLSIVKFKLNLISSELDQTLREISKMGSKSNKIEKIYYNTNRLESSIHILDQFVESLSHKIYITKFKSIKPSGISNHYEMEKRYFTLIISDKIYIDDILYPRWSFDGDFEGFNISDQFNIFLKDRGITDFNFNSLL